MNFFKKLLWYFYRAKTISINEWGYRIKQQLKNKKEKFFYSVPTGTLLAVTPASNVKLDIKFSELNFSQNFKFFNTEIALNSKIDFHLDPTSGKSFPKTFSKQINIRSEAYGSAKVVWEVNRLQFLIPILIKYKQTSDVAYLNQFVDIMKEWDFQNEYLKGVNWYSNIEVNIRLINWFWCWSLLEQDDRWNNETIYKDFKSDIWIPLIYKHCYYSYHNPSYFSSANNHLISDYAGLYIASSLWKFKESDNWLAYAKKGLEKEILLQHHPSGINKEEAAEYIQFITDFFLLSYVVGLQYKDEFSKTYKEMLIKIINYISVFLDSKGNFPKYGDEDDGRVILPDGDTHSNNFISILNTAAVLFGDSKLKRIGFEWDIKSELLTCFLDGRSVWEKMESIVFEPTSMMYNEEGHFFLKSSNQGKEIFAHFDAAQLGFLSIAAHGHADALSFFLNLDGFPFLVDPGTFTYHTHPEVRKYFVSTLAHNTITVDHKDQARLVGPTMWIDHYSPEVLEVVNEPNYKKIIAKHNGYQKLGVIHTRSIEFNIAFNEFSIIDQLQIDNSEFHTIQMPFHFHPEVKIEKVDDTTFIFYRNLDTSLKLRIELSADLNWQVIEARADEPLGWYSPSFMVKIPSKLMLGDIKINKSISLHTKLKII